MSEYPRTVGDSRSIELKSLHLPHPNGGNGDDSSLMSGCVAVLYCRTRLASTTKALADSGASGNFARAAYRRRDRQARRLPERRERRHH